MSLRDKLRKSAGSIQLRSAMSRLDTVIADRINKGEWGTEPASSHSVWRTQMHITTVITNQEISRLKKSQKGLL